MAAVTEHGSTDVSSPFEPRLAWRGGGVAGLVATAAMGIGITLPIWLGAVGFTTPPSIPNVTVPLLVWHLLYGLVLGALFPSVADA
jgi:hypothetical protein